MHALLLDRRAQARRWNWSRTGSITLALTLHITALLLLALPVDQPAPATAPERAVTTITLIEATPLPVELPLPVEPKPLPRIPRERPAAVAAHVPVTESSATTALAVAPAAIDSPVDHQPVAMTGPASAGGTNVSLAYIDVVNPRYPRDARRLGEQGTVLLSVQVDRDGRPTRIDIERSSGSRRLDRAAREAVQQWRFRPVQVDGVAVPARGTVPIAFNLEQM